MHGRLFIAAQNQKAQKRSTDCTFTIEIDNAAMRAGLEQKALGTTERPEFGQR